MHAGGAVKSTRVFVGLAVAAAVLASGCSENEGPSTGVNPYRDLTEREDCIDNLIISHKRKDIEEYATLLHEEYIWYGGKWGLFSDELGSLDRIEDIDLTEEIFQNTLQLDLDIDGGVWEEIDEAGGNPCTDCWGTIRAYHFLARDAAEERYWMSDERIRVIVKPIDDGGTVRYRIHAIYNIEL
jgi:hypothetical protein